MLSGRKSGSTSRGLALGLELLEQLVVGDGVVDRAGGEQGVEAAVVGGGVVLGENGLGDGALAEDALLGLGLVVLACAAVGGSAVSAPAMAAGSGAGGRGLGLGLEVVDVKAQHVAVINGVGDGVGV